MINFTSIFRPSRAWLSLAGGKKNFMSDRRSSSAPSAYRAIRYPPLSRHAPYRGVELKWFGDAEPKAFTSRYDSWKYIDDLPVLPNTLRVLDTTLDMRVPLTFDRADCDLISRIIADEMATLTV